MSSTTTVRVNLETQEILRTLAQQDNDSIQAVLDRAVKDYRRRRLLEAGNIAYEKLRSDPKAWSEELKERRLWEATLADGLPDESK